MNIIDIHTEAQTAAKKAVADFLDRWNTQTGGNEYGEPMYCGFAWVDVSVERILSTETSTQANPQYIGSPYSLPPVWVFHLSRKSATAFLAAVCASVCISIIFICSPLFILLII